MSHNHGSVGAPGVPSYAEMQRMYWAVVGTVVGIATAVNIANKILALQRFSDPSRTPARPKNALASVYATLTAMTREFSSASAVPTLKEAPPLGKVGLALANVIVVLVLCFYGLDTRDQWQWETIGYRTGFIAVAQLPLVLLLASKRSILGFLTDAGYERLNWLHRWTARTLWLTATLHMGFWFRSWARFNYIATKVRTDPLTRRGIVAWSILTLLLFASFAPVRRRSYELFFLFHVLTFAGFLAAAWMHAAAEVKMWVWISVALVIFDRLARWLAMVWTNLPLFRFFSSRPSPLSLGIPGSSWWANYATFSTLPGGLTKVTIRAPIISWQPAQHVFLAIPTLAPFQSHPFTIASLPSDGCMEFYIRAEKGATRTFHNHALMLNGLDIDADAENHSSTRLAIIDGPYGSIRPLRQFDSLIFFAGSIGATFTVPLLRDVVESLRSGRAAPITKRIRFIWAVRSLDHLSWFRDRLNTVFQDAEDYRASTNLDFSLEISFYLSSDSLSSSSPPSTPRKKEPDATFSEKSEKPLSTYPPSRITMNGGRPDVHHIIRSILEVAEGECGVIVCGPRGLNAEVRRSVVSLSDERAVHKGTGAQGIYLHVEEFGL